MNTSHSYLRRSAIRCIIAWMMMHVAVAPAQAAETPKVDVGELIKQLGADQYVAREDATVRLFEIGAGQQGDAVLKALQDAANQSDREIRERAKRILVLLNGNRRVERIANFLRGEKPDKVPGWTQFSKQFGDTKITRSVYGEMLKDEWQLLTACFHAEKEVAPPTVHLAIKQRFSEVASVDYGYQSISLGSSLSFFYLSSQFPGDFRLQNALFGLVRSSTALNQRLRGPLKPPDTFNGLVREMVSQWMLDAVTQDPKNQSIAISTTISLRLFPEAKMVAEHVLKNANSLPANKNMAMQTFAGLRDAKGVPLIEPHLKDDTKLRTSPRLQLRDVALACVMDLQGYDVAKIGVVRRNDARSPFDYNTLGFDSDKERQAAFDLFKELQAEKALQTRRAKKAAEKRAQP